MNNYADDLAGGACRTYDEYQKLCGVIQGLATAESYLLALLKKVEQSGPTVLEDIFKYTYAEMTPQLTEQLEDYKEYIKQGGK